MQVQPFSVKDIFRVFPKPWLFAILFSAIMLFVGSTWVQLFSFIINISATYLLIRAKTIIHEAGHLLGARAVGGIPKRMVLGIGHETYRTELFGIKIILNSILTGGYAMAILDNQSNIKLRYFVYIFGGVLLNVLIALLFYFLLGFDPKFLTGENGVDIASAIIFTNALGIINLLPFYTSAYGMKTPTDGLAILKLIGKSKTDNLYLGLMNSHFDAYESLENHEYDKAQLLFHDLIEKIPGNPNALINLSTIHIRRLELDRAIDILNGLEGRLDSPQVAAYKAYIYNNLAWTYLLKNEAKKAESYASRAFKLVPKNDYFIGTYGSVLVETGEWEKGMQMLNKIIDTEISSPLSLLAAMYLMVCFHTKGDKSTTEYYKKFVQGHLHKLEQDDLMIWERNLRKVDEANIGMVEPNMK